MMKKKRQRTPATSPDPKTLGGRIARLRQACGLTQAELAEQLGTSQTIVSEFEHDRRRLHAEMVVRVARALKVSTDELLGVKATKPGNGALSLKLTRRLKKIEDLPPSQQKTLLLTIDTFLKGAGQ